MSSSPTLPPLTAAHIPGIYRLYHLYFEPVVAVQGAVMCARAPLWYLAVMSPRATAAHYHPVAQVVFDQLAATYFLFAFNQAVVLRVAADNLRVWRAMLFGMLLCDLAHVWATKDALGGWDALLDPAGWRFYDWSNVVVLCAGAALRVAFLAGVGIKVAGEEQQAVAGGGGTKNKGKAKTG